MSRLIMLVDDDWAIRESLKEILVDEGFRVVCAANGREGLDYLQGGELPGLIFLDLMMPVMDGWQFQQAKAASPRIAGIPVVAVTAAGANQARTIAAEQVLFKPVR